jgi:hypothetical protein
LLRYIGTAGQAAQVKALVNMVMNINTAALAEGLALGDALRLDLNTLREVFSQTGANSRVLATDGEDMQNREHSCFFSAGHAAKDSGIALALAIEKGLDLPLAAVTKKQFDRMVEGRFGRTRQVRHRGTHLQGQAQGKVSEEAHPMMRRFEPGAPASSRRVEAFVSRRLEASAPSRFLQSLTPHQDSPALSFFSQSANIFFSVSWQMTK